MKNDENCLANYEALKTYIEEHHHLPDKHRVENRGLLNFTNIPEGKSRGDAGSGESEGAGECAEYA